MKRRLIAASALAAAAAAGTAFAIMPPTGGVIHGCVKQFSGALRIIDAETESCGGRERPISWNAQGPQGAPGVSGYEIVFDRRTMTSTFSSGFGFEAYCPAGKRAVGGGGSGNISVPGSVFFAPLRVLSTGPVGDGDGWGTSFGMPDGSAFPEGRTMNLSATAVCVSAS